ncbi:ABC transporter permease [Arcticibacterium luteifluviistationis]|uniref:ABC transporter permease n=1 Tax=Arcticibacterium luteifluviistationis TaxID=1784714 RepID=A0A2Z4GBF7_9BACT|nr:FtsX-like permease family protein [Arcticibacterium luteifluviistationis]AWV98408.1 ABC transporter permease [Arcticibacterium luteifluviistationis]
MNTEYFLAQKIRKTKGKTFSSSVINIGITSIAIGVAAIMLSFSVLLGFKDTIKEKLFSMSAHLQISKITLNQSFEEAPFVINEETSKFINNNESIASINAIALKSALLRSDEEISGVLLKGVDENYNWQLFEENIKEGRILQKDTSASYGKEIILSNTLKQLLNVKLGDDILINFIQNPPRARKVEIVGFYDTGIEDIDNAYAIVDIDLIRRINDWEPDEIGHLEVFLNDFEQLEPTVSSLYDIIPQDQQIHRITQLLPQFFDWFNLLDRNIIIVLFLIIIVASFNMVSVLLIMIMERTPMIGLLKSLGARNQMIQKIFISNAVIIILKGLALGNFIALGFCFIQDQFKLIPLDPENYYMSYVPVSWSWLTFLLVNIATVILVSLIVILPTLSILKISPVKALKYKD